MDAGTGRGVAWLLDDRWTSLEGLVNAPQPLQDSCRSSRPAQMILAQRFRIGCQIGRAVKAVVEHELQAIDFVGFV